MTKMHKQAEVKKYGVINPQFYNLQYENTIEP